MIAPAVATVIVFTIALLAADTMKPWGTGDVNLGPAIYKSPIPVCIRQHDAVDVILEKFCAVRDKFCNKKSKFSNKSKFGNKHSQSDKFSSYMYDPSQNINGFSNYMFNPAQNIKDSFGNNIFNPARNIKDAFGNYMYDPSQNIQNGQPLPNYGFERYMTEPKESYMTEPKERYMTEPKERYMTEPKEHYIRNPKESYIRNPREGFAAGVMSDQDQSQDLVAGVIDRNKPVINLRGTMPGSVYNPSVYPKDAVENPDLIIKLIYSRNTVTHPLVGVFNNVQDACESQYPGIKFFREAVDPLQVTNYIAGNMNEYTGYVSYGYMPFPRILKIRPNGEVMYYDLPTEFGCLYDWVMNENLLNVPRTV